MTTKAYWNPFGNTPLLGADRAMNVDIPKTLGYSDAMQHDAPVWWGSPTQVFITCGGCGDPLDITTWDIASDGTVSPSVFHTVPRCGWHVFVRLMDWTTT